MSTPLLPHKSLPWSGAIAGALALCATTAHAQGAVEHTLHAWSAQQGCYDCQVPPIVGRDGLLYGTTFYGGSQDRGTLYSYDPASGRFRTLVNFGLSTLAAGADEPSRSVKIAFPSSYLVDVPNGYFYGVTDFGPYQDGKIFRANRRGKLQIVHAWSQRSQGATTLMLANDGNLYGTSWGDGAHGLGTVFRLDLSGTYTVLHDFSASDGGSSLLQNDQLLQASDGALYGASLGGANSTGSVWRITLDGKFSVIYDFGPDGSGDGANPTSRLVQGSDGALYGTTQDGGPGGWGTVYRVTLDGHESVLHAFNHADGRIPMHGLTQDAQGVLYGTAEGGGTNDVGVFYRITLDGDYAVLYSFGTKTSEGIFPDGVTFGPDGNFYSFTAFGGKHDDGAFVELTLRGAKGAAPGR